MSNDDDDVLGIDLDAWQAPPVPTGIADGVIARMRQETTTVTTPAVPVDPERAPTKRWWWIGGAALVAAAAGAALVAFGLPRPPPDGSGGIVAEQPAHLALGPSSAELDRDTVVSWRRDRYRVTAQQAGGAATWRVDDDDTLTIETALGSIEATNASLRVEVKMLDEKKAIVLGAVTAAAVTLVTVVVYKGTVGVTDDGKSTRVLPGTAYQIKAKGENVFDDQMTVGAAPSPELIARVATLEDQLAQKQAELDELKRGVDPFEASADPGVPDSLGRAEISRTMHQLAGKFRACADGYDGKVIVTVRVNPDGSVANVTTSPADAKPSKCIADALRAARFAKTKSGGRFKYPLVFTTPADTTAAESRPPKACDFEELKRIGLEAFAKHQHADALAAFEKAYTCKADANTLKLVVASACKAKNRAKLGVYWKRLSQSLKDTVLPLCVREGITSDELEGRTAISVLSVLNSTPVKVLIDGRDSGITPLRLELAPGKHTVTFVVGADKYTYPVDLPPDGDVTLAKELE